eukprot:2497017-Pyramimonas_sp.AAC.1
MMRASAENNRRDAGTDQEMEGEKKEEEKEEEEEYTRGRWRTSTRRRRRRRGRRRTRTAKWAGQAKSDIKANSRRATAWTGLSPANEELKVTPLKQKETCFFCCLSLRSPCTASTCFAPYIYIYILLFLSSLSPLPSSPFSCSHQCQCFLWPGPACSLGFIGDSLGIIVRLIGLVRHRRWGAPVSAPLVVFWKSVPWCLLLKSLGVIVHSSAKPREKHSPRLGAEHDRGHEAGPWQGQADRGQVFQRRYCPLKLLASLPLLPLLLQLLPLRPCSSLLTEFLFTHPCSSYATATPPSPPCAPPPFLFSPTPLTAFLPLPLLQLLFLNLLLLLLILLSLLLNPQGCCCRRSCTRRGTACWPPELEIDVLAAQRRRPARAASRAA